MDAPRRRCFLGPLAPILWLRRGVPSPSLGSVSRFGSRWQNWDECSPLGKSFFTDRLRSDARNAVQCFPSVPNPNRRFFGRCAQGIAVDGRRQPSRTPLADASHPRGQAVAPLRHGVGHLDHRRLRCSGPRIRCPAALGRDRKHRSGQCSGHLPCLLLEPQMGVGQEGVDHI